MADPRIEQYARLLVETCVDVQPGWQVVIAAPATGLARPLAEEVTRQVARRGAFALQRSTLGPDRIWIREAPEELLGTIAPLDRRVLEEADALIALEAPENTREASAVAQERLAAVQAAFRPAMERIFTGDLVWVGCQYPTPALAQEAGMSTEAFADFLYGACLLDWDAERVRMQRYADRFEAASEVRIVGDGTDLRLGIAGRPVEVDAGGKNIPGGEFFCCPVEDSAEGTIHFSEFPAVHAGRELRGIRLRFEGGRVVDAGAETNEEFLLEVLDSDEGARRLGELGIGCNPGITRYMKNTLFDEKIDGTVHLALGNGIPEIGGRNESSIHWDIVKDLRSGGRIELDGELVQADGAWSV
jgi:aminopeptidase